jgi:hypothetical protein
VKSISERECIGASEPTVSPAVKTHISMSHTDFDERLMKKQLWNSLTAIVLLSSLGISGASHAQSSPKADRQSREATFNLSTSAHEPQKNVTKLSGQVS